MHLNLLGKAFLGSLALYAVSEVIEEVVDESDDQVPEHPSAQRLDYLLSRGFTPEQALEQVRREYGS